VLIVVDTESAGQAALLVDNISDQRQFVIKSLDTHYRSVEAWRAPPFWATGAWR
jgi:two-component system chemotaxis sensor kinase CheA